MCRTGFAVWPAVILAGLLPAVCSARYSGGSGTQAEPFRISAVSDWQELMATPADWAGHFILTSDMDLNGVSITPIAPDTSTDYGFQGAQFTGVFDGNDYVIGNADVNMPSVDCVGLFGYLGKDGQIKNLGVEDASIFGKSYVSGLVGYNSGTIKNCYSTGSVSGTGSSVGGLVGSNGGTIISSYSIASVKGAGDYTGGLVGHNYFGPITNSYSTGSVSGQDGVGGLVGENDSSGMITKCYSTGGVSGNYAVGGLVGWNKSTVTASFWDTQTSGQPGSAGGTPKTTAEMKIMSTFTDVGWDFVNVWHLCEGTNYPRLLWQIPAGDFLCPYGVDVLDLAFFVDRWLDGDCNESNDFCNCTDINYDARVDFGDFAFFSTHWLEGVVIPENMVPIPGGEFAMGDNFDEGDSDERHVHTVTVDSFYMGKYEITNQQYCDFLNWADENGWITVTSDVVYMAGSGTSYPYCDTSTSSSYSQIAYSGGVFSVRSKGGRDMSNDPMVQISWYGSAAYCNWRSQQGGKEQCYNLSTWNCDFSKKGYRLATEAEWEYAARGGLSGRRFPWGNDIYHTQANYYSDADYPYDEGPTRGDHPLWHDGIYPTTSPVGFFDGTLKYKTGYNWPDSATSYQTTSGANSYGLYDMAGNVFEWCNDWYQSDYYTGRPSPDVNPTGPAGPLTYRVLRSGGWSINASSCRVAGRNLNWPDYRHYGYGVGFRVVLSD